MTTLRRFQRDWSVQSVTARTICVLVLATAIVPSAWAQGNVQAIRVGAFPKITHAQATVGKANGWFDRAMGPQVKVQWTSFNAGPSAIEALFSGAIQAANGAEHRVNV